MAKRRHLLLVLTLGLSILLHSGALVLISTGTDTSVRDPAVSGPVFNAMLTTKSALLPDIEAVTFASPHLHISARKTPRQALIGEETGNINPTDIYFPPSKLSVLPSPIDSLDPTPKIFANKNLVGEAEIMLLINEKGGVDRVFSIKSTLPDPVIDHAKHVFLGARFTPGQIGNQPVKSRIRIGLSVTPLQIPPDTGNPKSAKTQHRN